MTSEGTNEKSDNNKKEGRGIRAMMSTTMLFCMCFARFVMTRFFSVGMRFFAIIVFLLFIDFRSMAHVLLAMFPLMLGTMWMVGAMNLFGIGYNFSNVMAIPLILGIGIDSGVHMVHRHVQGTAPAALASTTGKAIVISSLTTMLGFGSMVFGAYGGMQSLGITLLLGVSACLVATVIVLPTTLAARDLLRARR